MALYASLSSIRAFVAVKELTLVLRLGLTRLVVYVRVRVGQGLCLPSSLSRYSTTRPCKVDSLDEATSLVGAHEEPSWTDWPRAREEKAERRRRVADNATASRLCWPWTRSSSSLIICTLLVHLRNDSQLQNDIIVLTRWAASLLLMNLPFSMSSIHRLIVMLASEELL